MLYVTSNLFPIVCGDFLLRSLGFAVVSNIFVEESDALHRAKYPQIVEVWSP